MGHLLHEPEDPETLVRVDGETLLHKLSSDLLMCAQVPAHIYVHFKKHSENSKQR